MQIQVIDSVDIDLLDIKCDSRMGIIGRQKPTQYVWVFLFLLLLNYLIPIFTFK
jgi:hypothetical protein